MKFVSAVALSLAAATISGCAGLQRHGPEQSIDGINFEALKRSEYEVKETLTGTGTTDRLLYIIQTKPNFAFWPFYSAKNHDAYTNHAAPIGIGAGPRTLPIPMPWMGYFEKPERLALYDVLYQAEELDADTVLPQNVWIERERLPLNVYVNMHATVKCKAVRIKTDEDLEQ